MSDDYVESHDAMQARIMLELQSDQAYVSYTLLLEHERSAMRQAEQLGVDPTYHVTVISRLEQVLQEILRDHTDLIQVTITQSTP